MGLPVYSSGVTDCSPTNVTWVIRWPSKQVRDRGWEIVDSSEEYGQAKALRGQMCADAGFDDGSVSAWWSLACPDLNLLAFQSH